MKKGIFDLIKKIYGSNALSKVLGTRTNVIRLPDNEVKRYIKQELNIEAASDKLAQKAKEEMGELIADLPKMNDAEKLILEGNLRRLANKLGVTEKGPAADVIQFTTKEKISPEGVMSLTEKIGQKNAPGTLMGNLESRIKQLEASGEDLSKLKGKTYDEFMKDITQGQKAMRKLEDEGLVRATAREIIDRDIKSGKIKLPKEIEQDIVQGGGEPINVFRQFYGEDALEQLDSMIPEFKNMYSTREAADAATKKFNFEFKADRPPGSISIEDAKKAKVYRNTDPDELINEYNKNLDLLSQVDEEGGTLIGYQQFQKLQNRNTEIEKILNSIGIKSADSPEGKKITEALIGKPKASVTELVTAEKIISDMKKMDPMDAMYEANKVLKKEGKYKNLKEEDIKRIMDDTNDYIFERDIPKDPEGFAKGGTVSKGLDYLMGVERRGYAEGGTGPSPDAAETYSEYKARMLEALRKSHGGQKTAYTDVQPDGSSSGISRDLPIEDYFNYMLADAYALGFNPNTGLKFGVDDRGVLTDQYKFKQEMADFKKNSQTTPTEDFSDYLNTTTINTNAQTTPIMGEPGGIITDGGLRYRINADGSRTLLDTAIEQTKPTVAEQMMSPEDALTPEIPSNNVLDQWKAHAEATQAMKGETGLDAIPEYGFQTGYDFQSKFPNLDPRIGAGLASGYQVLTEGLGMFNPNNPNFLNPAAAYKTALSDATKNIEGIMAFDQNLMTPQQQENRNKYLKSVGQDIIQQRFPTYQQDLENYRQRQAAVDPNALRNRYLENLQNTSSQDINQFQSQLRSNLVPRENQPQGLDYLTGQ
jgi:hypothetical protein